MSKFESLKERIKKNFKENKVLLLIFLVVWIAILFITINSYKNVLGKQSIGNEGAQEVVEIYDGIKIKQNILVNDLEGAESICIKFATYARTSNSGEIFVKVTGNNSKTVYVDETINVKTLVDNDFLTLDLSNKLLTNNDKTVTIEITSNSKKGYSAGIYCSSNDVFENGDLYINNKKSEGDLSARFLLESDELSKFYEFIIIFTIVTFSLIILVLVLINPRLEVLFTVMTLVFGLIFWLIITPMSVPDETTHYEYSLELSNIMMGEKNYRNIDAEYQNYGSFAGHFNISAAYLRLVRKINKPLQLDNEIVKFETDVKDSYITAFVPQALGITIARLLNFNMLRTFYLGRLFNLIFYVICVYIAVKNTPIHKILFGAIATLPIFIQQAASFSYDCFINGLTLVMFAFILKWMYQDKRISIKDIIFVFIVNSLVAPVKVVYGLFSLLFWFVPTKNFGNRRNKIIGTLIATAPAMYETIILVYPLIYRVIVRIGKVISIEKKVYADIGESTYNYAPQYSPEDMYSFGDVLRNPLEAIEIFARTIRYNIKNWFYGAFGRTLSGGTLVLPINLVHAMLVLLIVIAFRKEDFVEPISFKVATILICCLEGLMMLGGMLISWTPKTQDIIEAYGGPIIQGMQGRYFCPMLVYFFAIFNNKKLKLSQKFDKYMIFIYLILVFEVIVYVLAYTFVN